MIVNMIGKFYKIRTYIFVSILLVFFNTTSFGAEMQCFPSVENYMSKLYGENYKDDDNISMHQEKYGKNIFYIVTDTTSGTNYVRSLLRKKTSGEFCLILLTQPVSQLVPRMIDKSGIPRKFIATEQAPPGLPEHIITYVLNEKDFRYSAHICKEVSWVSKTKKIKTISCN